jgi:Skp family chaperone for outer membrane proteins
MIRALAPLLLAGVLVPSLAAAANIKICVVDAQTALNETAEGKAAQTRLETVFSTKKAELDKMQADLQRQLTDYESRKMILSETARQTEEKSLLDKQQKFQALVVQSEQDMQGQYQTLLAGMEDKLMKTAEALGAKSGCTILFPKEATIYAAPSVVDLTAQIIKDLDAAK